MHKIINAAFSQSGEMIFDGPYLVWDCLGTMDSAICYDLADVEGYFLPPDIQAEYDEPISLDEDIDADATGICVYDINADGDFATLRDAIREDPSILYPLNTIQEFAGDLDTLRDFTK